MNILIDTSPLSSGHAIRGIGLYTKMLVQSLRQLPDLQIFETSDELPKQIDIDLVHYPFFDFFSPTLPLLKRKPTVVTIHDVIPLLFPKEYPAGVKGKLAFTKQWAALRSVAGVITDSQAASTDIVTELKVPAEQVFPIHLAANPLLGPADETMIEDARRRFRLPKKYVLYVGDINYNKNLPQLIKAMKYVPSSYSLVMVGKNFTPQDIPEWNAIAQQLALSDMTKRTKFLTKVGADDVQSLSALYTGAAVYVQPSLYEGFGLPVLEAMRCMTPVVAAQRGSLPEIADHHAVFVEPTAEAMTQAINQVIEWHEAERQVRTQNAFEWQQQFTWQKTAEKTAAVYQYLLTNK